MRRALFVFALFVVVISSAFTHQIHIGAGFMAEYDYVSSDRSDEFLTMQKTNTSINNIRRLGLAVSLAYYPYDPIQIGVVANYQLKLPIGVKWSDGSDSSYICRTFMAEHNFDIGASYNVMFTKDLGMYVDAGASIVIHTIPNHNNANDRREVVYSSFDEYGVYADLGIMVKHKASFYKVGLTGDMILSNNDLGLSFAIKIAGGYSFSF